MSIAMILGGCVLSVFGIGWWVYLGGFAGLIPGAFGVLGVLWIVVASLALARRREMAIIIDERGIDMPTFPVFERDARRIFIRRQDIATVSKHESIKGRLIEIGTADGKKILVQARHYCGLDQFLSHCQRYGLPVG